MLTIGLIGGMSWESTLPYYRIINREVAARLGGFHSAKLVLYSVDFHEIELLQEAGRWAEMGEMLAEIAQALKAAGADFCVLCTNTMHKVADSIEAAGLPLLHIADAAAARVKAAGLRRVGLLGTRFTMEEEFYRGRLLARHGLEALVPGQEEREIVHRIIYRELCLGEVLEKSRAEFARIADDLIGRGAEGIILGCTEIGLLLRPEDVRAPLFDTAEIHAEEAAKRALGI